MVKHEAIPWDQTGAKTGVEYKGDALSVSATSDGARLCCTIQRLDAEITRYGIFLSSTVSGHFTFTYPPTTGTQQFYRASPP